MWARDAQSVNDRLVALAGICLGHRVLDIGTGLGEPAFAAARRVRPYDHPLGGLLYSISVLDCLACSTYEEGDAGLGTLGLPEPVAREMTAATGFARFTVRDFGNPSNSFYDVRP